ncbi:hypothetical protein ACXJY6_17790, partial [Vibrio sp. RC27]
EPYAVKVARTVLRGAALGNKCRLLDQDVFRAHITNIRFICAASCCIIRKLPASSNVQQAVGQTPIFTAGPT